MTEPSSPPAPASDSSPPETDSSESHDDRTLLRVETRLAHAEAQIRTLQEGVAELNQAARLAKQRALYLRIGILLALLGAFFYTRSL